MSKKKRQEELEKEIKKNIIHSERLKQENKFIYGCDEFGDLLPPEERNQLHTPRGDEIETKGKSKTKLPSRIQARGMTVPRSESAMNENNPEGPEYNAKYIGLSRNMWGRCNPGYLTRRFPPSETKDSFRYERSLVDKTPKYYNRKRDEFSSYVEAAARFNLISKGGHGGA